MAGLDPANPQEMRKGRGAISGLFCGFTPTEAFAARLLRPPRKGEVKLRYYLPPCGEVGGS